MLSEQYIKQIILERPVAEDSYLARLPAVQELARRGTLPVTHKVTFLVGENGTGKSTLLEAIAVAYGFNPEGGTRNFNFSTTNAHSGLYQNLRISKGRSAKDGFFLRAESFFNVASYIDELDRAPAAAARIINSYGGVSLHEQSHGESFLALVQNRFGPNGIYLLDEPEAALSPMRLLVLLAEMNRLVNLGAQFIIATHSPMLMAFPGAEIWEFTQAGIQSVSYQETEHYQLTRRFLEDPERFLKYLLAP